MRRAYPGRGTTIRRAWSRTRSGSRHSRKSRRASMPRIREKGRLGVAGGEEGQGVRHVGRRRAVHLHGADLQQGAPGGSEAEPWRPGPWGSPAAGDLSGERLGGDEQDALQAVDGGGHLGAEEVGVVDGIEGAPQDAHGAQRAGGGSKRRGRGGWGGRGQGGQGAHSRTVISAPGRRRRKAQARRGTASREVARPGFRPQGDLLFGRGLHQDGALGASGGATAAMGGLGELSGKGGPPLGPSRPIPS